MSYKDDIKKRVSSTYQYAPRFCSAVLALFLLFMTSNAHSQSKTVPTAVNSVQKRIRSAYFRGDLVPLSIELVRSAKTKDELLAREFQMKQLSVLHGICQTELKQKRNPYHCYRVVEIERAMKFLTQTASTRTKEFLDDLCHLTTQENSVLNHDELIALSTNCRQTFHLSDERKRYVMSESGPDTRFNARFENSETDLVPTRQLVRLPVKHLVSPQTQRSRINSSRPAHLVAKRIP